MKPEEILALSKAVDAASIAEAKAFLAREKVVPVDFVVRVRGTVKVGKDGESKERNGGIDPWAVVADLLDRVRVDDLPGLLAEPKARPETLARIEEARNVVKESWPILMVPRAGSLRAQVVVEEPS